MCVNEFIFRTGNFTKNELFLRYFSRLLFKPNTAGKGGGVDLHPPLLPLSPVVFCDF